MESRIFKIVEERINEINNAITQDSYRSGKRRKNSLLSLKILFPKNSKFETLKSVLALNDKIKEPKYKDFENEFYYGDTSPTPNTPIIRSLYYLDNDYQSYDYYDTEQHYYANSDEDDNYCEKNKYIIPQYNYHHQDDIKIDNTGKYYFSDLTKKENFWSSWCQCFDNHWKKPNSTLRTCLKIRLDDYDYVVSAFLVFAKPIKEQEKVVKICHELLNQIITEQYIAEIRKQETEIREQATRASIAQVMARCMSHNLGSHVISKMVTVDAIRNKSLGDAEKGYSSKFGTLFNEQKPGEPTPSEYLEINFNSYMRSRMDYLADISTGEPSMEVTRLLVTDIIAGIDKNRILMNNISGVDNFPYSVMIKDCRNNEEGEECKGIDKDIPISIPNDSIGYHALYVIIENIIRNTAKHQFHGKTKDGKFAFSLEIRNSTENNMLYEACIYDNVEINNQIALAKLVDDQNSRLKDEIIDYQTNRLRNGAWGLIEMEASASYLRKLPMEISYKDVIKAFAKDEKHLAYRFQLMKPKEMLVIDEVGAIGFSANDAKLKRLEENGIYILNKEEYEERKTEIFPHPFLLVIAGEKFDIDHFLYENVDNRKIFRSNIPSRIIICHNSNKKTFSRWYAQILINDPIIEKIKSAEDECFKCNPFSGDTIMDLAWQIWTKNKQSRHQKNLIDDENGRTAEKINKYIFRGYTPKNFSPTSILFDYHADNIKNLFCEKKCIVDYYESYPSAAKTFFDKIMVKKQKKDNLEFSKTNLALIAESIFISILIIDERIQKICSQGNVRDSGINRLELLKASGVYIPTSNQIDLNRHSFNENYIKLLEDLIKEISDKDKKEIDFIVVHLGVIEKMLLAKGEGKEKKDVLNFVLNLQNILQDNKTRVIITSGRGKPNNLPECLPFVAFSSLSQNVVEIPFKPFLNQIIQSARKLK